jgi:hypothetical protein
MCHLYHRKAHVLARYSVCVDTCIMCYVSLECIDTYAKRARHVSLHSTPSFVCIAMCYCLCSTTRSHGFHPPTCLAQFPCKWCLVLRPSNQVMLKVPTPSLLLRAQVTIPIVSFCNSLGFQLSRKLCRVTKRLLRKPLCTHITRSPFLGIVKSLLMYHLPLAVIATTISLVRK